MKKLISSGLRRLGYQVSRLPPAVDASPVAPLAEVGGSQPVVSVERFAQMASQIPGMVTPESGKFLYTLCYMQEAAGDVVEIGSWQGRSTSFLARAVKDSGNGVVHAIDHFRGNAGKEPLYVVGKTDLSDLRAGFERNLRALGLWDHVHLIDQPSAAAAKSLRGTKVRLLFIDGDHTKPGVQGDIDAFFPLLIPGAIVVFDDYAPAFPGLVGAVDAALAARSPSRVFAYKNTLVARF